MSSVPPSVSSDSSGSDPNLPPIHQRSSHEPPQDALDAELVAPDEWTVADVRGTLQEASAADMVEVELDSTQQGELQPEIEFIPADTANPTETSRRNPSTF